MLKRLVNEFHCKLRIATTGPLLVKSGHPTSTLADMTPVRTYRRYNGTERWEVYLPGSSLKGVFRSHLEKICRTLKDGRVCNPFLKAADVARQQGGNLVCPDFHNVSCGDKLELCEKGKIEVAKRVWERDAKNFDTAAAYSHSCPVCRLFGSVFFKGRISIDDAYLTAGTSESVESRDGVGIDRLTGGAADGAKFELEVVSSGVSFDTEIVIRNFETYQLGMLLVGVTDLVDGLIRIGSGGSRGLGAVTAQLQDVAVHTFGPVAGKAPHDVLGLGSFLSAEEVERYGTIADDRLNVTEAAEVTTKGLRRVATFSNNGVASLIDAARVAFVSQLDDSRWEQNALTWKDDWQSA